MATRYFYVIFADKTSTGDIVGLKPDEQPNPDYLVSVDEFPIAQDLIAPVTFTGDRWQGSEPSKYEPVGQMDLTRAIASGDQLKAQEIARKIVEQYDRVDKEIQSQEQRFFAASKRKQEAIANIIKVGSDQPLIEKKPGRKRRVSTVQPDSI